MKKFIFLAAVITASSSLFAQKAGSATVLSSAGRTSCDWVQLWENGSKWAVFNVGATITDYANITVGADETPCYNTVQAPYYNTANVGGLYAWENPNLNGRKTIWTSKVATGIDDIATSLWGSNWATPSKEQFDSLKNPNLTNWTWCDGSSVQFVPGCTLVGFKISGKRTYANSSIFLPAAGEFYYSSEIIYSICNIGEYWTSTTTSLTGACYLDMAEDIQLFFTDTDRQYGMSIRAVMINNEHTDIENIQSASTKSKKIIKNGQLIIEYNGKVINAQGAVVE